MSKSILELDAASIKKSIGQYKNGAIQTVTDWIAREEPLEIKVIYGPADERRTMTLSITMRTPGNDYDLVRGFLFTEGLIRSKDQIQSITYDLDLPPAHQQLNSLLVSFRPTVEFDAEQMERHFYTTSSCGICGKTSIDMVKLQSSFFPPLQTQQLSTKVIDQLSHLLENQQSTFQQTGGIHAAALLQMDGTLIHVEEDIGRHNAVDKLIGWALEENQIPLRDRILFVSGRTGFELIQKAVMAGITFFVSIGAASSLAIELAEEHNMTLIGFLGPEKFNVYSGAERIS
jgi:FdhD protein